MKRKELVGLLEQVSSFRAPVVRLEQYMTSAEVGASAAHRGQHNDEILTELGKSHDEILALRNQGIVG